MDWHDYTDSDHPSVKSLEAWFNQLTPWAREVELGRLDDVLEAAARGELEDSGDARTPIKPINRDPELYEIRHRALAKQLRFYHGEPHELPTTLVSVHRHVKNSAQDQEHQIREAASRYLAGRSDLWNIG